MADEKKIQQKLRPRPGGSPLAVYNPADVERVASERAAADARPFVMPAGTDAPTASGTAMLPALRDTANAQETFVELLRLAQPVEALEHREILTIDEAVRLKGFPARYLEELNRGGVLKFYKLPGRRGRLIRRSELDELNISLPEWPGPKDAL